MRALVLDGFGSLSVHEVSKPVPRGGQVLVKVFATGICGSDIHGFTGETGRRHPGQVMGHESAGVIAAIGDDVQGLDAEVGDPVTFNPVVVPSDLPADFVGQEQRVSDLVIGVDRDWPAAFADYLLVPARNIVPLGNSVPLEYGALAEPIAVALHSVARARVWPGARVVVLGGGPIGQSVVIALRNASVEEILVSELSPQRRELLEQLGAAVVDPAQVSVEFAVRDRFGTLADVAIDAVGLSATLSDALSSTRRGGTVCLVGMGSSRIEFGAFLVSAEERTIVGSFAYSAEEFREAARLVADSATDLSALVSRVVSPEQAPAMFAELAEPNSIPGKVLVRFDGDVASG